MIAGLVDSILRKLKLGALERTEYGWDLRLRDHRLLFFDEWTKTCDEIAEELEPRRVNITYDEQAGVLNVKELPARRICLACNAEFDSKEGAVKCPSCRAKRVRPQVCVRQGRYPR